jgi:hypothetical protein
MSVDFFLETIGNINYCILQPKCYCQCLCVDAGNLRQDHKLSGVATALCHISSIPGPNINYVGPVL